ncbi:MAG TPA: PAS domain S-box protein [Dehalococcoidia bacterium]|nr:PAS domain S-box protein [Dehalococcoidia bacterium]
MNQINDPLPLQGLLDSAPDGFIVVAADGAIVWANRTAEAMFGYDRTRLTGIRVEALVPDRLRPGHVAHRTGYQETSRLRPMGLGLDLLGRRKDGSEFPVEISLSPLETKDGLLVTAVVRDITERRQLENERSFFEKELEMERERDRIAMDLHDGIMQDIYAASLTLELSLPDNDEGAADATGVNRAIDQLHEVVRNIRSYIFELRPREFAGNLAQSLSDLADEFQQNSQIETAVTVTGEGELDLPLAVALYNVAHEGLSNVQRHANASRVTIALKFNNHGGRLEISDDGVGFDASASMPEHHRGLRNMAARARAVAADLMVESLPGSGSKIVVAFPLN